MKKNMFYGIVTILFLLLLVSVKFYNEQKIRTYQQQVFFNDFKQKVDNIEYIKKYYIFKNMDKLSKYCKIQETDRYHIVCKNLNAKQFTKVEKLLFNPHNKIISYNINLNKNFVNVEGMVAK